jgi:hypothetical protein
MRDHGKHRRAMDVVRRQENEQKERERWLRSRLPLDADQQAKVDAQLRKIKEREVAERREQSDRRTD